MRHGNWHDGIGNGTAWWLLMVILMIAAWSGLIWIGIALIRRDRHTANVGPPPASPSTERPSAEEILAERLARGEIDIDDYRQRLDALRDPPLS